MRIKRTGFTLVELLVVISIISILTVITVGQFTTARKRARDAQRKGDLNNLAKAINMYYTDLGKFPDGSTINSLLDSGEEFNDGDYVYMKVVPVEKVLTDYRFCYKVDDDINPKKYALFGQLEITSDEDCTPKGTETPRTYQCGGQTYCYAITSANTKLTETGELE